MRSGDWGGGLVEIRSRDLTTIDYYTIIESMRIDLSPHGGEYDAERRARVHAALGDPARLSIVDRLLLADASPPSELQGLLSMPSNLVAHHLRILEEAGGVVQRSRSEADRRRTYLQLVPAALEAALPPVANWQAQRVVFVCSHNSARSPLAVAIWNRRSTLPAVSAGTHPATKVHPGARRRQKNAMAWRLCRTPRYTSTMSFAPPAILWLRCATTPMKNWLPTPVGFIGRYPIPPDLTIPTPLIGP